MTNFISVQLKKASEVDLAKPLCKFIQQSYPGGDAQAEHCRAAEELSKLRKNALGRPLDKHDACLDTLLRIFVSCPQSCKGSTVRLEMQDQSNTLEYFFSSCGKVDQPFLSLLTSACMCVCIHIYITKKNKIK
ncbi:programmed cell death 6-interacting protein-like isoform X3 [Anas acuta]|uniref:programmed cell death 6-interacting protein-like isoform X3 n=1 Tax=Anas acuta TaxID=28680 RepID=UPI0035C8D7A7